MKLSEKAQSIVKQGSIKLRVSRSGIFQQITFRTKSTSIGNIKFIELYTERTIELTELAKIAEESELPVEAPNGRAFPKGKGATDFQMDIL